MPIDEEIIPDKLGKLDIGINDAQNKLATLRRLKIKLENIKMVETSDPQDDSKKIKILPIDTGINKPMTPARRQELYDSVISEIDAALK